MAKRKQQVARCSAAKEKSLVGLNLLKLNIEQQEDANEPLDLARAGGDVADELFESRGRGDWRMSGRCLTTE